jgi:hypothetical protein
VVFEYRLHSMQWRPSDLAAVEADFRDRFVASLEGSERALASRIRSAGLLLGRATSAYNRGEYRLAFRDFRQSAQQAPALLRSPLVGPHLRSVVFKSALGMILGRRSRAVLRIVRSRPGSASDVIEEPRAPELRGTSARR